jgi:hypothetical protein
MTSRFLGAITGTTLTVNSVASGTIAVGDTLYGTGVLQGTFIVSGSGSVWIVNLEQTVVSDGSSLITSTAFNNNITPGRPPLLWSDVQEAFVKVNENFDIIVATVGGGSGLTPIDFSSLDTDVSPTVDQTYQLGDQTHKWKNVHTSSWSSIPGSELNGLWAGPAHIKGIGLTIDLPPDSTVDGKLIIDPDKSFFNAVQVDNDLRIEALGDGIVKPFGDTLNLLSGTGINLSVDSSAESITIDNTGILSVTPSTGITSTTVAGVATIANDGVVSLANSLTLPPTASGRTAGAGIVVSAVKGSGVNITNTGVLDIQVGSAALLIEKNTATGVVTITNSSPAQNAFTQISVNGDVDTITADSINDTLNINSGEGITLTKNLINDILTIAVNPVFDLQGSIFADNSTLLVDAVSGVIPAEVVLGTFTGNVIGVTTGTHNGNVNGDVTGSVIGDVRGSVFGDDSSLLVDAVDGIIVGDVENAIVTTQILTVGQIDPDPISGEIYLNGTVYGDLQGVVYGTTVGQLEGDVLDINGDLLLDGTSRLLEGDVKGSVFGDDSGKIIDGVENRVYTNSLEAGEFIKFPTYADAAARDLAITAPEQGMVILIINNGSAVTKLQAYISSSWIDL